MASVTKCANWRRLLAVTGCIAAAACSKTEPVPYRPAEPTVGSLSLQIHLAGSIVPKIEYAISSDGAITRRGAFLPNGRDDVFTAVVGALPAKDLYSITFDAKATNRQTGQLLPCGGSADFRIVAGQTTVVGVLVRCSDAAAVPGALASSAASVPLAPHRCANISAVRALPGEAPLGKQVMLKSEIDLGDATTGQLHIEWSANTGTLVNDMEPEAMFQCTRAGVATVTLKLSEAFEACREQHVFVYVTCRDTVDALGVEASGAAGAARAGAGAGAGGD